MNALEKYLVGGSSIKEKSYYLLSISMDDYPSIEFIEFIEEVPFMLRAFNNSFNEINGLVFHKNHAVLRQNKDAKNTYSLHISEEVSKDKHLLRALQAGAKAFGQAADVSVDPYIKIISSSVQNNQNDQSQSMGM